MKDYYEILGVSNTASADEIKQAYRKLSLKFHPDKNPGDNYFEEWSKKINEAYEILGNVAKRQEYDKKTFSNSAGNNYQQKSSSNSANSAHSSHSQVNKLSALREIKNLTLTYLNAREELRNAYVVYESERNKSQPKKFGAVQILVASIFILIGFIGVKNSFSSSVNTDTKSQDTSQKMSTRKPEGTKYKSSFDETKHDIYIPENSEEINSQYKVVADKVYFYFSPVNEEISSKFLPFGEKIITTKSYENYVYCIYTNSKGKITAG